MVRQRAHLACCRPELVHVCMCAYVWSGGGLSEYQISEGISQRDMAMGGGGSGKEPPSPTAPRAGHGQCPCDEVQRPISNDRPRRLGTPHAVPAANSPWLVAPGRRCGELLAKASRGAVATHAASPTCELALLTYKGPVRPQHAPEIAHAHHIPTGVNRNAAVNYTANRWTMGDLVVCDGWFGGSGGRVICIASRGRVS